MLKLNNKGVTLIEIVVALAISVIILATAAGILLTSYNFFKNIAQSNEDKLIGDTIYTLVSDKITLANEVEIINEQNLILDNENTIEVNDGKLFYNGEDIFGGNFNNGQSVSMNITQYSSNSVSVYVYVWQDGRQTYNTGSVIKLLNYEFS